jgi:16S rRNA (guanine(527)-N(7))-methyltransferase RsmG
LLDSLAVVAPLQAQIHTLAFAAPLRLLDVGSGAGLPGVVLAICLPDLQVDCVDTVAKKASFIQQVALSLGLSNLRGLHARVERIEPGYQLVSARAFSSLPDLVQGSDAALVPGGIWMAMKGKTPTEEMQAMGWLNEDGTIRDGFKTPAQGAATSTWAAVGAELEGVGGLYLEECREALPFNPDFPWAGVREYAIDRDRAAALWELTREALATA